MTQTFEVQPAVAVKGRFLALVPLFTEQMVASGYAPASLMGAVRLAQAFATWLEEREICDRGVEPRLVDEYLDAR